MPINKKRVSNRKTTGIPATERIRDLQRKISDSEYINNAIDRIATVVSGRIVDRPSLQGKPNNIRA